jgi:dTMP kinase
MTELDSIELPSGPRSETVKRILREQMPQAAPIVDTIEPPWSLERRIARIAAGHPAGSTFMVHDDSASVIPLSDIASRGGASRAASRGSSPETRQDVPTEIRLLPIPPEHPEDTIRRVLTAIADQREKMEGLCLIPCFLGVVPKGQLLDHKRTVSTRMAATFWGLFPGDDYGDELRDLHHDLIKTLHPDRYLRFLAFENHALAGFDLYDEALRGRDLHPVKPKRRHGKRAFVIAIDGIDGAGKSTQLHALKEHLEGRGMSCAIHKIYRHGVFHDTVTDLTRRCAGDANLHLWRLQRVAKVFDSLKYYFSKVEADLDRYDVLLFDRYLGTHFAAGLGRYHHDPYTRELLSVYPAANQVYLLDLPVETALDRIAGRSVRTVDENPYMLTQYRQALLALAREEGWVVLDATQGADELRTRIHSKVDSLFSGSGQ